MKSTLLDQAVIAGIGNIYASEALWQARLSPLRPANTLTLDDADILLNSECFEMCNSCWRVNLAGSFPP
ncbi:MAG: hypothetical protein H0X26_09120 [Alphaproteobacteria bacterium]|nr:hypothetical protein [Alphaproteobacteria bacterium]